MGVDVEPQDVIATSWNEVEADWWCLISVEEPAKFGTMWESLDEETVFPIPPRG